MSKVETVPNFDEFRINAGAGEGTVNVADLLAVINGWGPCPTCATQTSPPQDVYDCMAYCSEAEDYGDCLAKCMCVQGYDTCD